MKKFTRRQSKNFKNEKKKHQQILIIESFGGEADYINSQFFDEAFHNLSIICNIITVHSLVGYIEYFRQGQLVLPDKSQTIRRFQQQLVQE
jgi:hypothetical protein